MSRSRHASTRLKRSASTADLPAARREGRANGLGINVAHQLADVLPLARAAATAGSPARLANGIDEAFRKIERDQLGVAQTQ